MSDSRVDPSDNNNQAIKYACRYGHYEIVKLLLKDSRVDPTAKAFRYESWFDYYILAKLLLKDSSQWSQ